MATTNFEAESPKAHAVRVFAEIQMQGHDRGKAVAVIAQAFREWEARGLEDMAAALGEIPAAQHLKDTLLVRAKELRGRSIELA